MVTEFLEQQRAANFGGDKSVNADERSSSLSLNPRQFDGVCASLATVRDYLESAYRDSADDATALALLAVYDVLVLLNEADDAAYEFRENFLDWLRTAPMSELRRSGYKTRPKV